MKIYQPGLQLKDLIRRVEEELPEGQHCQPYVVDYLRRTNRLSVHHKPSGKGDVTIFSHDAIFEVLSYLNRNEDEKA